MSEWFETRRGLWDRAWQTLARATADHKHAFHTCALATTGLGGAAEARMVVLRSASRARAHLGIQTDRASRKVAEIEAHPLATLLFWDPRQHLQVRARVEIEVKTGADIDDAWARLSDTAARNYGGQPPPGTPMQDPDAYRETAERERFAVLSCTVTSADILHLGNLHRRALFNRGDDFAGIWVGP